MQLTPLASTMGATVSDLDLTALTDDSWGDLYNAFLEYALLIFPDQHLSAADQEVFAKRFGAIEQLSPKQKTANIPISNRTASGGLAQPQDFQYQILKGNEGWHTDSTYMPLASKAAMLTAIELPAAGGETEFADMRAAWDALDTNTQAHLDGLSAYHSLYYSQARAGFDHQTDHVYGLHTKGAPLRPLVKTHPETGRKSLYIGRHAYGIPGLSDLESQALLDALLDTACQSPRVYRHKWAVGDTVVWDNRCLLHRACPYEATEARVLRGTRIAGHPDSELAATYPDPRAAGFEPSSENRSKLSHLS